MKSKHNWNHLASPKCKIESFFLIHLQFSSIKILMTVYTTRKQENGIEVETETVSVLESALKERKQCGFNELLSVCI